jgi:hypothetical protein
MIRKFSELFVITDSLEAIRADELYTSYDEANAAANERKERLVSYGIRDPKVSVMNLEYYIEWLYDLKGME